MNGTRIVLGCLSAALLACACGGGGGPATAAIADETYTSDVPASRFYQANGLNLHYLDWGN